MSAHAADPRFESPLTGPAAQAVGKFTGYWRLWLVAGIAWIVISAVLLQFDQASVTTVGVLVGFMFTFAGAQNVAIASAPREALENLGLSTAWRWVAGLFAVLFFGAAIASFISPENTFAGLADMLGFLFLLIGMWWIVRAFQERPINSLWWARPDLRHPDDGPCVLDRRTVLDRQGLSAPRLRGHLALMEGIVDVVRAFEIREVHKEVEQPSRSS